MSKAPRFEFVPTLAVCMADAPARRLFEDALALPALREPGAEQRAYGDARGVFFVDARGQKNAPVGFLPLFVTDDLERAKAHLVTHGCTVDPLPWEPEAPAWLVRAPEGVSFCVGSQAHVVARRARRLLVDNDDDV